jgi:hypothetical protein
MNGSTCMIEVFINVCCASSSGMMIWINGVFELLGGEHFYGTHWLHGRVFTWDCWNMYNLGGCIIHLNKSCQTMACLDLHHHCQTLELTKPLDHTTILKKSSLGNSKGLCLISSPLGSFDVMGLGLVICFVGLVLNQFQKNLLLMYMYTKSSTWLNINQFFTLLWTNEYELQFQLHDDAEHICAKMWWAMGENVHPWAPTKSHHSCGSKSKSFIRGCQKKDLNFDKICKVF